jgi:hypothetical protein
MFGLTLVLNFALDYLLLERCARTEQHNMLSMLFGDFDYNLHGVLLSVCSNYTTKRPKCQPKGVVKKPHSPGEVPGRVARPSGPDGGN